MILLVDDDPKFLAVAERQLSEMSPILLARSAQNAYDLLSAVGAGLNLALVDLDMPEVNGFEVIRSLHERAPKLPIIAISGVQNGAALESTMLMGASATLQKPISPEWSPVIRRLHARLNREK